MHRGRGHTRTRCAVLGGGDLAATTTPAVGRAACAHGGASAPSVWGISGTPLRHGMGWGESNIHLANSNTPTHMRPCTTPTTHTHKHAHAHAHAHPTPSQYCPDHPQPHPRPGIVHTNQPTPTAATQHTTRRSNQPFNHAFACGTNGRRGTTRLPQWMRINARPRGHARTPRPAPPAPLTYWRGWRGLFPRSSSPRTLGGPLPRARASLFFTVAQRPPFRWYRPGMSPESA